MAGIPWLNVASAVLKGGKWLGQKVITPGLNWLKQNDQNLAPIVKAAEPLTDLVGKAWNYADEAVDRKRKGEYGFEPSKKPKALDVMNATLSAIDTSKLIKEKGGLRNLKPQFAM